MCTVRPRYPRRFPSLVPGTAAILAAVMVLCATGLAASARSRPQDLRGHWAEGRIAELIDRGVITLGSGGLFRPNRSVTRAQFVAWVVAARGLPAVRIDSARFSDLPPGHNLRQAVETAAAFGIVPAGGAFRPDAPITRGDAMVVLVRSLGHTFEAGYMAGAALPFRDAEGLPPTVRGAIAVAALSTPPLLREPPSERVRPNSPMTRAEAASLVWAYLQAVERGTSLRFTLPMGSGIALVLEKRGALRTLPVWRIQVGAFVEEERAHRLADMLRGRGLPVTVEPIDEFHKVRVGNFVIREEAEAMQQRLAAEGFPTWLILTTQDYETLGGPFWTGVVLIEPGGGARLRPALARDGTMGRARTSEAARRAGAIAAVNGGFFTAGGDPLGCLVIDGEVLSEPIPERTCVGIADDGTLLFDTLRLDAAASTESSGVAIDGINRARAANEIVLYRPEFGSTTQTNPHGAEVVVAGEIVQQVADGRGNSAIPSGGYVLSGNGRGRAALTATFKPGDRVMLRVRLVPAGGDPRWDGVRHIIGGGPRLLANGQFTGGEGFRPSLSERRHPRTAIARLADGRIVLAVVGGRQPYHSLGMTLVELAALLRALGATDALNLDGGGSSTLVVRGTVLNLPSDEFGERPVSDVLLVLPPAGSAR